MRAYSMDLRERALLDSDAGMKAADVAAKYRVSGSWVRLLKQRRRETGEVAPRVQRHGRRPMLEPPLHTLPALIAAQPDRTLAELKDALATPASVPTVWRAVHAIGLTVQGQKRSAQPNTIGPDVAAARVAWQAAAPTWDPTHLVFLDETGITNNLLRRFGRAPRGARVHDHVPGGRWQTSTLARRVAGYRTDRPRGLRRRDRWRELPSLHRTDPGADPTPRRPRHRRQPQRAQGRRYPASHPGCRGHALVSAAL